MVLAGSVFSERIAKNRHLVFVSCDNCRPYGLDPLHFSYKLQMQNVVVSSIDDYRLIDLDTYGRDERPIGNYDNLFFFSQLATTLNKKWSKYAVVETIKLMKQTDLFLKI